MNQRTWIVLAVALLSISLPDALGGDDAREKARQAVLAAELKSLEGMWEPMSVAAAADGWGPAGKGAPGGFPQGGKGGKGGKKGGPGGKGGGMFADQFPILRKSPTGWLRIHGKDYSLLTLSTGRSREKGFLRLDPSQTPKTLDLIATEGPNERTVFLGIYEVKGDELRICIGEPRPTEFTTGPNGEQRILRYRRIKVDTAALLGGSRPGGPRFEYKLLSESEVRILDPRSELDLERGLNRLGEAGWELISTERTSSAQLYFKRAR